MSHLLALFPHLSGRRQIAILGFGLKIYSLSRKSSEKRSPNGFGQKIYTFSRKSSEKGAQNGSISANCLTKQLSNCLIANERQPNKFVERDKGRKINLLKGQKGEKNKQTGKGKLKMTKVNQNPHTSTIDIDYKFKIWKPAQITSYIFRGLDDVMRLHQLQQIIPGELDL